jgi:hypothetical protein
MKAKIEIRTTGGTLVHPLSWDECGHEVGVAGDRPVIAPQRSSCGPGLSYSYS